MYRSNVLAEVKPVLCAHRLLSHVLQGFPSQDFVQVAADAQFTPLHSDAQSLQGLDLSHPPQRASAAPAIATPLTFEASWSLGHDLAGAAAQPTIANVDANSNPETESRGRRFLVITILILLLKSPARPVVTPIPIAGA